MKIAPVTKIAALLVLSAGLALTGCTQQADDDQTETGGPENTEGTSQHPDVPYSLEDFIYVTEDGTAVRCIASTKRMSCDWEGATRPSDAEGSAPEADAQSEQGQ